MKDWLTHEVWAPIAKRMHKMRAIVRDDYDEDGTFKRGSENDVTELAEAKLLGSRVRGVHGDDWSTHILAIDLDMPAALVPSSTPGHFHLYIDHEMYWYQYERVLLALATAGIIEAGYYEVSKRRQETHLRVPWVSKHAKDDDE